MLPVTTNTTSTTTTCSTSSVTGTRPAGAASAVNRSNILIDLKDRCSFYYTLDLPTDVIKLIFKEIFLNGDIQSFASLSSTNAHLFLTSKYQILKEKNIVQFFCPELTILDAKAQGLECINEPPISLKLLSEYSKLASCVESNLGLTLVTVIEDLTLNQVISMANGAGIEVKIFENEILKQLGDKAVGKTYRVLITNAPVIGTRNKSVKDVEDVNGVMIKGQETLVCEAGFDGLPTPIEYLLVSIHTQKISKKCLYGRDPLTYGRTSVRVNAYTLVVGGSPAGCVNVFHDIDYEVEDYGAGGQRK